MAYKPPLADIDFALNQILDLSSIAKLNGFQHADPETVRGVLEEAGRFFSEVIAPLNQPGDREGSKLLGDGTVKTPAGFREAYAKYVAGRMGWGSHRRAVGWRRHALHRRLGGSGDVQVGQHGLLPMPAPQPGRG